MPTRLATVAPELDAILATGDRARSARAGLAAALFAAEASGLSVAAPNVPLTEANLSAIDALVGALDNEYLSLQQPGSDGAVSKARYLLAFSRARAASAVAFALRGDPREAIYEAILATDDAVQVTCTVTQVLQHDA